VRVPGIAPPWRLFLGPDRIDADGRFHLVARGRRADRGLAIEFSAELRFELLQPGVDLDLLLLTLDDVFTIALEEVADGFHANFDRPGRLVFVDILEGEVRSAGLGWDGAPCT